MDFQSEKSFGKLRRRAFQPYHQILYMSTLNLTAHNFLNFQRIFNPQKVFGRAQGFSTIPSILYMSILSIKDKDL